MSDKLLQNYYYDMNAGSVRQGNLDDVEVISFINVGKPTP